MTAVLTYLEIQRYLEQLKLNQVLVSLDRIAEEASKGEWSYLEFLGRLLSEEIVTRRERRLALQQRLAHFPWVKTLDQFDFSFQGGVDEKKVRELASLRFLEKAEMVLLMVPQG